MPDCILNSDMMSRRTLLSFLGLSLAALGSVAHAQNPPATGVALSAANSGEAQSELLFGQNTKGPYLLAWKGIRANSETVWRDGLLLTRDRDYTFAPDTGILAFDQPLKGGQTVRITYHTDTADAKPNEIKNSSPLSFELLRSGSNRLIFQTQLGMANGSAGVKAGNTAPGIQYLGGMKFARNADLSTGLYLDMRGGDWMARSGLSLSQKTTLRNANLAFSYARAGAEFSQAGTSGLAAGRELMEATGAFQLMQNLQLTSFVRQRADLLDRRGHEDDADFSAIGDVTREYGANLAYVSDILGKLEAGRIQSLLVNPTGGQSLTTSDTLKVEKAIDKRTQISANYEATATDADKSKTGEETYAQNSGVSVTTRPLDGYLFTGNYRNTVGTNGVSDAASFKMDATPFRKWKGVRVRAGWDDQFQADGARRVREALVDLPALKFGDIKLSGGMRQFQKPGQERYTGIFDASFRPARSVQISGGVRLRNGVLTDNAPDPNAPNTYDVKMAYAPLRSLRLTGNFTRNPGMDDSVRNAEQQAFGLETDIGAVTLRGKYGTEDEYLADKLSQMIEVGFDLRFSRYTSLTTSWQERSQFDTLAASNTLSLGFRHELGSLFNINLGASMTTFGQNGAWDASKTEIRGEAKVGIKF